MPVGPVALRIGADVVDDARANLGVVDVDQQRERYARDPFALIDDGLVWIFDVETKDEVVWTISDQQREIVAAWIDLDHLRETGKLRFRNALEEKSRQIGATTVLAYACMWAITFHTVRLLMTHIREEDVDDGGENATWDSFFGKVKFMHDRLPYYVRAQLAFKHRLIRNLQRPGAFLRGATGSANPGRGKDYHGGVIDEAARIPFDEQAHASLTRSIPNGRFYNSTPEGEDNVYARLATTKPYGYEFLRHHWSSHPLYGQGAHVAGSDAENCRGCLGNRRRTAWSAQHPFRAHRYPGKVTSPWYDLAVVELTDEQVAQELDIDYAGSLTARVYPEFSDEVHVVDGPLYDAAHQDVELAWDYGADITSVVILQDTPTEALVVGEYETGNVPPEVVVDGLLETCAEIGVPLRLLEPVWTRTWLAVGDPAGEARQQAWGDRSLVDEYRRLGINIVSERQYIATTINAAKRLFMGQPKPVRASRLHAPGFVKHAKGNRWPVDRFGRRKPGTREPLNDVHNHMMRAFAYWTAWKWPPPTVDQSLDGVLHMTVDTGRLTDMRYGEIG